MFFAICEHTTSTCSRSDSTSGRRRSTPRWSATIDLKSSCASRSRRSRWDSATSRRVPWCGPPITPMNKSQPRVRASWLGSIPYREAWDLQAALVRELREGAGQDTLLLLEHPHVFTLGKAAAPDHVLWNEEERARRRVEVVWSDRGGEATYHGQGQLVGYPVVDLIDLDLTIPQYLER